MHGLNQHADIVKLVGYAGFALSPKQRAIERRGRIALHVGYGVRIDVERDRDRRMSEQLTDDLWMNARS